MDAKIVLLPGDGIGPEVVAEAEKVLNCIARSEGHVFEMVSHPMGGNAIDSHGDPLPDETLQACQESRGILLGAVGGPRWDDPNAATRPESGLLRVRKELGLFANLRPIKTYTALLESSPLRREIVEGVDILCYRELTGGIYFGQSGRREHASGEEAYSEMVYSTGEVERIVRLAGMAARNRKKKLTSIDKANVLEVSRLWRTSAENVVRTEFSDLEYENVLVDAMAMHLISRPRDFDVVVTGNMFGDIITDEGSMLTGSLGMLPSASLGEDGPGLYEPIHGSAPDIAGQGIANPLATILASAMLLRHSLGLENDASRIERAVDAVLDAGHRTADITRAGDSLSTQEMGAKVIEALC
ncbi:MAG: 3-isopropylmalate dehydrogenase [Planctomycetaceae bacterium]